jgi:succinyl-diaminopimelate desuccinylase
VIIFFYFLFTNIAMVLDKIYRMANNAEKEVSELCSRLVQINSAHPKGHTDKVVDYIKRYLDKQNIENAIHAVNKKKPNIVAKVKGESKKTILWVGHIDVVPEGNSENWTFSPYSGKISEGFVWGRGSSDMKGACAAAMVSARILNELDKIHNNVEYWFTSDEEIGGKSGARWLAETGRFKGDVCIIGDGSGGGLDYPSINLGCKGAAGVKLVARGKTAHGSIPYLGDNAIKKLITAIPWIEKIDDYKLDFPKELNTVIESSIEHYRKTTPPRLITKM